MPRTFFEIDARLARVLDLTDDAVRRRLRVSEDRMRGESWTEANDEHREALTQAIGAAAAGAGFEALVARSAPCDGINPNVFPHKLLDNSHLRSMNVDRL